MPIALCPICDTDVVVRGQPSLGQRVICLRCKAALFIVWWDPVELDWSLRDLGKEEGPHDLGPDQLDRAR